MEGLKEQTGRECIDELLEEVASREGVDPTTLPPLYDTVDPDALERLVDSSAPESFRLDLRYCGYRVTVDDAGTVTVTDD